MNLQSLRAGLRLPTSLCTREAFPHLAAYHRRLRCESARRCSETDGCRYHGCHHGRGAPQSADAKNPSATPNANSASAPTDIVASTHNFVNLSDTDNAANSTGTVGCSFGVDKQQTKKMSGLSISKRVYQHSVALSLTRRGGFSTSNCLPPPGFVAVLLRIR